MDIPNVTENPKNISNFLLVFGIQLVRKEGPEVELYLFDTLKKVRPVRCFFD